MRPELLAQALNAMSSFDMSKAIGSTMRMDKAGAKKVINKERTRLVVKCDRILEKHRSTGVMETW